MALGTIAPWLQLPDFISAAHAGASIGLQQRKAADDVALERDKLAQSAIESSGRLGLGYTEAANAARRAAAEQELAKATLALHQGRYSELSRQADERHQLGLDRLTALEDNRDTINDYHDRTLDATVANRQLVNSLREKGLDATIANRGVVNGIRQSALDETVKNRGVVNGIRQAALDETISQHGAVNDLHDRALAATIDNRSNLSDYRDRVLGERTANHDRAAGMKTNALSKPFMVKVPVPANAQTGAPATIQLMPSTYPAAQAFLKANGLMPADEPLNFTGPSTANPGELAPSWNFNDALAEASKNIADAQPPAPDDTALAAPSSLPYTGAAADEPAYNTPGVYMGSQAAPAVVAPAEPAAPAVLTTGKKRFRFDPKTGKFDPVE